MTWYRNNETIVAASRRRGINPFTSEEIYSLDCRKSDGTDIDENSSEFALLLRFDITHSANNKLGPGIEVKNLRAFDAKGIDWVPLLRGTELYGIYEYVVDTWQTPGIAHTHIDDSALKPCPVCGKLPERRLAPPKGELLYSRVWCGANDATWDSSHARIEHISGAEIVQAWNREERK